MISQSVRPCKHTFDVPVKNCSEQQQPKAVLRPHVDRQQVQDVLFVVLRTILPPFQSSHSKSRGDSDYPVASKGVHTKILPAKILVRISFFRCNLVDSPAHIEYEIDKYVHM